MDFQDGYNNTEFTIENLPMKNVSVIAITSGEGVVFEKIKHKNYVAHTYTNASGTSAVVTGFSTIAQRDSFSVTASVAGKYLETSSSSLQTADVSQRDLDITARTSTIYNDSDAISIYIRTSPPDFGAVAAEAVTMVVSLDEVTNKTFSCGTLSAAKGMVCTKSLNEPNWFTTEDQEIFVYVSIDSSGAMSSSTPIVMSGTPDLSPNPSIVWLNIPSYPLLAGETFSATIFANTTNARGKDDSLSTWSIEIPHDAAISLVLDSVESDLYDIVCNDNDNILSAVATYKTTFSSSPELLTGFIQLGSLEFEIASSTAAGILAPVFTVNIVSMIALNAFEYVESETGSVFDHNGLTADDSELVVIDSGRVAIDGYVKNSVNQQIVNTFSLGNTDQASVKISVAAVTSCHTAGGTSCQEGSTAISTIVSGFSCDMNSTDFESIAQVSSDCELFFDGTETEGGDIVIRVSDGTFIDYVPFRIWFPESVQVKSSDTILNKIADGCGDWAFQRSELSAVADFALGNVENAEVMVSMDVTKYVSFCVRELSGDNDIVTIDGTTVYGINVGSVDIVLCTNNENLTASSAMTFNVTQQEVMGVDLNYSVILNAIVIDDSAFDDTEAVPESYDFNVGAYGTLKLTSEGDEAWVFAFASFSDGSLTYLDSGTNTTSMLSDIVDVTDSTNPATITVPVGGSSGTGSNIVSVSWSPCISDDTPSILVGNPWVTVALPAATSVEMSVDNNIIYFYNDPLVTLGVATEAIITVVLGYEDGSTRNMEEDTRTLFSASSDTLEIAGNVASAARATNEQIDVSVSFGNYAELTANIIVKVTQIASVSLSSKAYPTCTGDSCADKVTLNPIQNSDGIFQRLILSMYATDFLGETFDVDFDSTVAIEFNDTGVVAGIASGACNSGSTGVCSITGSDVFSNGIVTGVAAGAATVKVDWYDYVDVLTLTVDETPVTVSAVAITSPTTNYIEDLQGEEIITRISTTFSDGTMFKTVKSDGSNNPSSWISMNEYLNFSTSDPGTLETSNTGTLTLWNNTFGDEQILFKVISAIDSEVGAESLYYCNLEPACYDVDIGMEQGAPLPGYSVGDSFNVPIRMNTCNQPLTGFQIEIYFDPSVVLAVKDGESNGDDWPGTITYTYGSPSSMVLVLSSEPSSTADDTNLLLTTLQFEVVGIGSTWFTGLVVDSLTSDGERLGESYRLLNAGVVYFTETSARLRRQLETQKEFVLHNSVYLHRELSNEIGLRGDTNGDGLFTVSDLDTIKRYYVGSEIDFVDETAQLVEMDADLDGEIDTLDIVYINSALAKKISLPHE
jgi:hypothetical protein